MAKKTRKKDARGICISRNNLEIIAAHHPDQLTVKQMIRRGLIVSDGVEFVITDKGKKELSKSSKQIGCH